MTLLEVMAALAIVSLVLSSTLVARARFVRQTARASKAIELMRITDGLLTDWWRRPLEEFPRSGRGIVPGRDDRVWIAQVVQRSPLDLPDLEVVRVTVFDSADKLQVDGASIDVVIPSVPPARQPVKRADR